MRLFPRRSRSAIKNRRYFREQARYSNRRYQVDRLRGRSSCRRCGSSQPDQSSDFWISVCRRLLFSKAESIGAFIEDQNSGTILLQQAQRRRLPARPIDLKLTLIGKDERAFSVSGYVHRGMVKYSAPSPRSFPIRGRRGFAGPVYDMSQRGVRGDMSVHGASERRWRASALPVEVMQAQPDDAGGRVCRPRFSGA